MEPRKRNYYMIRFNSTGFPTGQTKMQLLLVVRDGLWNIFK